MTPFFTMRGVDVSYITHLGAVFDMIEMVSFNGRSSIGQCDCNNDQLLC